jgi:hypothetical protein
MPQGFCEADLFEACADPQEVDNSNNTWADADQLGNSAGCVGSRDTIVERTPSVTGIMCPREPADWYAQTIVPCDTLTLTVEVRVTPQPACEADEWQLVVNRGGARIGCDDPRITCLQEGATKIARWTVPPANSVESWYFGVENVMPASRFEYTATMTIR